MSALPVQPPADFPGHGDHPECNGVAARALLVQPWCQKCPDDHDLHPGCPDDGKHPVSHEHVVAETDWYTLTVEQIDDPTQVEPGPVLLDVVMGNDLWVGEASQLAADLLRADVTLADAVSSPSVARPEPGTVQN